MLAVGQRHQTLNFLDIVLYVCHLDGRHRCRYFHKSVFHIYNLTIYNLLFTISSRFRE